MKSLSVKEIENLWLIFRTWVQITNTVCTLENQVQNYHQRPHATTHLNADNEVKICRVFVLIIDEPNVEKSNFKQLFPLFHLDFRRLEERSVLLLLGLAFAFGLEAPPAVHTPVSCFLRQINICKL